MSRLLGAADVRRIATELDVRPTKKWGQNFVIDPNTVERIVRVANVSRDDVVVEVGPGLGSLTLALLQPGAQVVAVEIDARLADRLPRTISDFDPAAIDDVATGALVDDYLLIQRSRADIRREASNLLRVATLPGNLVDIEVTERPDAGAPADRWAAAAAAVKGITDYDFDAYSEQRSFDAEHGKDHLG